MTLPEDFIHNTERLMGARLWQTLAQGLAGEAPVSIRLNPLKCAGAAWQPALCDGRVPWCDNGFYLSERPNFTFDPLFHAGLYYVQEASSMFLDRVLRQHAGSRPVMALDLCAAPGGKSTVARGVLPEGSLLVCNEPVRARAHVLAENILKYGHPDVIVTNNYPEDFNRCGLAFDLVIADVPCSGEGMFRKDEAAVGEWSLRNVEKCRRLQREIVASIWPCLKPGGLLVYSTCTFNSAENEENVRYISEELGAEVLGVDVGGDYGITGSLLDGFTKPVFRFIPGLTRGEGLFMAVMRKHEDGIYNKVETQGKEGRKDRRTGASRSAAAPVAGWLKQPAMFETVERQGSFVAIPKAWKHVYDAADKCLKILSAGVTLGEVKGRDVVPSQSLALSAALDRSAFANVELDYTQAISYLRKEAVALPAGTPRGYVLLTYKGVPLGFEKNIGNRANNLYPAEWRIKSTHTPDTGCEIIKIKQL